MDLFKDKQKAETKKSNMLKGDNNE